MAAFAAKDPLCAETPRLGVHLGVELLGHVERHERTEVAAFRRVGRQRVVQPEFVEEHEIAHERVDAGIGEHVARRRDEQNFMPLLVEGRIDADARDFLDVVTEEFHDFLEGVRLDAKMVARAVAVGHRLHDPVDAKPDFMQQFASNGRDFGRVDAVGAEKRTAAALGALVEVVEPLLDHVLGKLAAPRNLAEQLADKREILAVDRAQKFGAQHGHVFRIVGAEEEMTLVRTGAATHAGVHEKFQGTVFGQPFLERLVDDLFPVFRQVPVFVLGLPGVGVGHVQALHDFKLGGVTVVSRLEGGLYVHPSPFGERRTVGDELFWARKLCHEKTP